MFPMTRIDQNAIQGYIRTPSQKIFEVALMRPIQIIGFCEVHNLTVTSTRFIFQPDIQRRVLIYFVY